MSCLTWSKFIQSPFAIQWCLHPLLVSIPNYSLFQYFCTKNVWHFPYVSFLNGLPVDCFQRWEFDTQLVVASMNITTQDFVDGLWWPTVINTLVSISILLRSSAFHQKHYCLSLPPDVPCYHEKYRVTCYWLASENIYEITYSWTTMDIFHFAALGAPHCLRKWCFGEFGPAYAKDQYCHIIPSSCCLYASPNWTELGGMFDHWVAYASQYIPWNL